MRRSLFVFASIPILAAVASSQAFDTAGNPLNAASQTSSGRAAGDVLSSITGPSSPNSDLAYNGATLLVTSYTDGQALIYGLDDTNGTVLYTVPTNDSGDFGLAYDDTRVLYATTKTASSGSGSLKTFDGVNGTPVNSWPTPSRGPVGAAYDASRDVYWVCDWTLDSVTAMNAAVTAPMAAW